jgi:hypothetical protein
LFASTQARERRQQQPPIDPIQHISSVTVHVDDSEETVKAAGIEEFFYRMRWIIKDKNDQSGEVFVINVVKRYK